MIRDLSFAGGNLRSRYGVMISGSGVFNSPVRAYQTVQVPGRSGDLLLPEKRLENITVTYPAYIVKNFDTNFANLRAFLLSKIGYQKIVDSYHPDEYRMGFFQGPLEPVMQKDLRAGSFNLTFICKPQRFLTDGDDVITMTTSGTFSNPTRFESLPLIKVYKDTSYTGSSSELSVGDVNMEIDWSSGMTGFRIDCELMSCYYVAGGSSTSVNHRVTFDGLYFPTFKPGDTGITIGSGISRLEITPRTFTL